MGRRRSNPIANENKKEEVTISFHLYSKGDKVRVVKLLNDFKCSSVKVGDIGIYDCLGGNFDIPHICKFGDTIVSMADEEIESVEV